MKINDTTPPSQLEPIKQPANRSPRTSESGAPAVVPPAPGGNPGAGPAAVQPGRSDRVEISDEARSRAAQLEGERPAAATPSEKPSIDEIRQRIRDGVYETDQALDSIARRILERGDL